MARSPALVAKIRELLRRTKKPAPGGSLAPQVRASRRRRLSLPFREPIVRCILGDFDLTRDLCEVMEWSPEAVGSVDFLSRDPFQQIGGETASWFVAKTRDGSEEGSPTHPDVLAIAESLRQRMSRKVHILGGDRLQSTYSNALWLGDGYAELEIARDGLGGYGISRIVDVPSLTVFHNVEDSEITKYEIRSSSSFRNEVLGEIPWWKMLHLSCRGRQGRYGVPLFQPQIDSAWRPLKSTAEDMLDIIRANGAAPWVHTYGKDSTASEQEKYRRSIEEERETRILTDVFLSHGGSVTRAGGGESAIAGILQAKENYRALMLPPGVPSYLFPGMQASTGNREIATNQRALNHSRGIADARSKLGAQVKWAITLEIVLRKGYDFWEKEGQFEIAWPKWFVTGFESDIMTEGSAQPSDQPETQATTVRVNRMMRELKERQDSLLKLSNIGRLMEEVEANV